MSVSTDDSATAAASLLEAVSTSEAEAIAYETRLELTRFAGNLIHQSVAESALRLRARVQGDNRVGVAEGGGRGEAAARRVAGAAEEARKWTAPADVAPLPEPDGGTDSPVAFSSATDSASPEERAELVAQLTRSAAAQGLLAYGAMSTQTSTTAVHNTKGLRRQATSTQASMVTVVRGENGSGYAARHSPDIRSIDVEALAREAVDTCLRNQNARPVDPGVYEVVVSPYAVADLLGHLSWVGFSALAVQEHRSFMRIGERLMSESVTIVDDAKDADLFPYPFDAEGVSTQVVPLIERGVCAGVVYDTPTARRDGVRSTGHSLPQPNTWGPLSLHVRLDPGDRSVEDLIGSVRRGLYITRFWYVRDVHPLHTIITGMTRDGAFLIENGRLGNPVRDLRFTQSIVDAFNDVRGISRERILELEEGESGVLCPWMHLGHFTFTS